MQSRPNLTTVPYVVNKEHFGAEPDTSVNPRITECNADEYAISTKFKLFLANCAAKFWRVRFVANDTFFALPKECMASHQGEEFIHVGLICDKFVILRRSRHGTPY